MEKFELLTFTLYSRIQMLVNHLEVLLYLLPDEDWSFDELSANGCVTLDYIESRPSCPWNWQYMSSNPNITMEYIESNLDKPWDYSFLSYNVNITWEFVKKNLDKSWNWTVSLVNMLTKL